MFTLSVDIHYSLLMSLLATLLAKSSSSVVLRPHCLPAAAHLQVRIGLVVAAAGPLASPSNCSAPACRFLTHIRLLPPRPCRCSIFVPLPQRPDLHP